MLETLVSKQKTVSETVLLETYPYYVSKYHSPIV